MSNQQQQQQTSNSSKVSVLRCELCGTITHKIERTLFGKKKIPLTVQGKSLRGICLTCSGPDANAMHQPTAMTTPPTAGFPQELVVDIKGTADDATVVSAITLDHRFDAPDESDDDEPGENFRVTPGQRRPEPSLGDPDEYERPEPLRRSRPDHNNNRGGGRSGGGILLEHSASSEPMTAMTQHPTQYHSSSPWMDQQRRSSVFDIQEQQIPTALQGQHNMFDSPFANPPPPLSPSGHGSSRADSTAFGIGNRHVYSERPPSIASSCQEEKAEIEPSIDVGMQPRFWQKQPTSEYDFKQSASTMPLYGASKLGHGNSPRLDLAEIPALVDLLNSSNGRDQHVRAIQSLAEIVWEFGQQAKMNIAQSNGLEGLTQSMWTSMADASVQEVALNLMFALASSSDGLASSDVLIGKSAEDAVDALLICLQTHSSLENIQHAGCGILACLSAATCNNVSVDDASLSGALVSVVSAMEAHRNSKGVQEWGIRALYNQCVYSRHAESNKRSLAKSGMEENKCGAAVIYRAIEISEGDMVTVEWACRLYWCLSASEDVAECLTVTHHPIHHLLEALQRYHQVTEAAGLLEAIFGALANLVKVRDNHKVVDSGVLYLVVKSAQSQHTNEDLLIEACALIANLVSLSSDNAVVAVRADAIDVIFNGLKKFPENVSMFEEAMRCLTCLSVASEDAKGYLCTRVVLSFLANMHSDSAFGQEMFIQLMSSIMTRNGSQHTIIAHGGVDMLLSAMRAHPNDRRVQEAGCLAVRNLACYNDTRIDFRETINCITQAMAKHESSESIQLNGCCTLYNVASNGDSTDAAGCELSDKEMIQYIVKAMQTHMESAAVLEMACGALCSKISGSPEGKKNLVENGGLDAVTCVLVMHPNESAALEKAFGVLSCMSASTEFADDVASAQCMSNVVEAMRANSSCITLLEFGCLVLRNIILLRPEHVSEASSSVATILNAMREHPDAVGFQREACSVLWAMAAVSETFKSKVLALDGIQTIMTCLEHNSSFSDVQDAALGAFNQLSSGPT